jgi:branched-chain amino acid transport system substrate-binding protein
LPGGYAPGGELFTFGADSRKNREAASVVERFRAENFEPAAIFLSAQRSAK